MGFKSEKEYEDYLTDSGQWAYKRKFRKPTEPQRLAKDTKDDTQVIVNNGKIQTKNEFVKSLPIEDQPNYDPDKDPNLFRRIKYYQGESLGAEFDRAIVEEDKALKALGRDPANILQRNKNVKPLYPKRATTKQMVELKGKIDKYKDVHFSKEKPFIKKKITKPAANIPLPKFDFKPLPRMEVKTQTPEEIALEQNFNRMLRESEEEKFRQKNFGIGYFGRGTKFNE
jgi:hypothetical protein|tara:strand:- start:2848 stop:3528 length:681 start_codon:yes stop_codon:yes gene_type:complete